MRCGGGSGDEILQITSSARNTHLCQMCYASEALDLEDGHDGVYDVMVVATQRVISQNAEQSINHDTLVVVFPYGGSRFRQRDLIYHSNILCGLFIWFSLQVYIRRRSGRGLQNIPVSCKGQELRVSREAS